MDRASVQDDMVANGDLVPDAQGMGVVRHMKEAQVLNVRASPDPDKMHVSSNHTVKPHARFGSDLDIANDDRGVFDEDSRSDHGRDSAVRFQHPNSPKLD